MGRSAGHPRHLVDITERRRAEATVRQQEQQLQRSQRIEAIGRLAGGIAHEFNNLLTVIIGRTELLTGVLPLSHSGSDNLALIAKAGERAATLTRQLLAFSRKQVLQQRVVDLNRVVAGMVELLRPLVGETLDLVTALDLQPVVVKGDPTQIEQVIINLVLNSRDATPRGGRITIATQREDPRGVLEVSDTGCGMSAEVQAHLFEPFFTTKAVGKGNGLGLATVYGIVKQHEGDIAVTSVPGQGTTVKVHLPLLPDAVEFEEIERPRPFAGGSARILLVEDEPAVRDLAHEALARCGYRVLAAATPAEAQALAEEHHGRIDLLLTDVIMPELSGPELADRLTRGQRDMRVLYMSGYTDDVLADHECPAECPARGRRSWPSPSPQKHSAARCRIPSRARYRPSPDGPSLMKPGARLPAVGSRLRRDVALYIDGGEARSGVGSGLRSGHGRTDRTRPREVAMDEHVLRDMIADVKAGRATRRAFVQTMVGLGLTAPLALRCWPRRGWPTLSPRRRPSRRPGGEAAVPSASCGGRRRPC